MSSRNPKTRGCAAATAIGVLAALLALELPAAIASARAPEAAAAARCRNFTVATATRTVHVVRISTRALRCRGARRVIRRALGRERPPLRFDGWRCRRRALHRSWRCSKAEEVVRFREGLVIVRD
jgi:hypothetical protein